MPAQLGDGVAGHGVSPFRCDLGERREHEGTLAKPRMRHDEIRRIDDVVTVEDQIQIERARRAGKRPLTTKSLLDVEQCREDLAR